VVSDTDIAWAAGLFDGEGSTSVLKAQRDKYSYIRMSIAQKHPEVLEKFLSIVGVGKIYKANTRNIYSWDCYKQIDVPSVLNMLWPYLSIIKKEQAIKAQDTVDNNSK
jgi:hypothetical protein